VKLDHTNNTEFHMCPSATCCYSTLSSAIPVLWSHKLEHKEMDFVAEELSEGLATVKNCFLAHEI
jgi:hypothetical protein